MPEPAGRSLLDHFSALDDPRQQAKVLYPLPEILLLLPCATLAGAGDLVEIELWGKQQLAFLRRFRPYRHGIPSHRWPEAIDPIREAGAASRPRRDTLGAVLAVLDPARFKACFTAWVEGLREPVPDLVAIDGRPPAAATPARKAASPCIPFPPLRRLGAGCFADGSATGRWATGQRLVLGQEAVAGKPNETLAIPLLLGRLALEGALVTIDALGTQRAIAEAIRARGGDYLLALEANRPALLAEVEVLFADPPPGAVLRHETLEKDHGQLETRRHAVCHDVAWLHPDRPHPKESAFPGLAMLGMIESETERDGKVKRERRYYLGSARLDPLTFARAARGHWGIENRLHWVLDVVFRDDLSRLRTGHGPANMAVARHMAMNLLREARPVTSLKNRRKLAGWSLDYLDCLIRGHA